MRIQTITGSQKKEFDSVVSHPLQTYEWGEFREKTGAKVIRKGFFENNHLQSAFQMTLHKIPQTHWQIGYLPKGEFPTKEYISELKRIGQEEKCIFIQLEPNVLIDSAPGIITNLGLIPAAHPLFTKYTFLLDITKSEEEILKNMHHKARYNIKVAQRHGVEIVEDNSEKAFEMYWALMNETTTRQKFYAHSKTYHKLQWELFSKSRSDENILSSHLFLAKYKNSILAAWVLFVCKDHLYYPYGASSNLHREVMASNLMMWEAIRFGKKLRLKTFDMWGSMGPMPDANDPWYGFHTFKERYGPTLTEFIGSFDLVIDPKLYQGYKVLDKLRWMVLRIKK